MRTRIAIKVIAVDNSEIFPETQVDSVLFDSVSSNWWAWYDETSVSGTKQTINDPNIKSTPETIQYGSHQVPTHSFEVVESSPGGDNPLSYQSTQTFVN